MQRTKKGFTLVELVIVIAVIAILASVLIPTFTGIIKRANEMSRVSRVVSVRDEMYSGDEKMVSVEDMKNYVFEIDGNYYILGFDSDETVIKLNTTDINTINPGIRYSNDEIEVFSDVKVYKPITVEEGDEQNQDEEDQHEPGYYTIEINDGKVTLTGYYGDEERITIPAYIESVETAPITKTFYDYYEFRQFFDNGNNDININVNRVNTETSETELCFEGPANEFYETNDYWDLECEIMNYSEGYGNTVASITYDAQIAKIGENNYPVVALNNTFNNENGKNIKKVTVPENIENIGEYTFSNCTKLAEITLPDTLKTIGSRAFSGCTSLVRITLPENLETIGDRAFDSCNRLVEVQNLSDNITGIAKGSNANGSVGYYALNIYGEEGSSKIKSDRNDNIIYYVEETEKIVIGLVDNTVSSVTISDYYTQINEYAFYLLENLKTVSLGHNIGIIGKFAFAYSGLTSVDIPAGIEFGIWPFACCRSLETVTIADNATLSDYFCYSSGVKTLTIGNVQTIPYSAFGQCYQLTNLTLADGIETIGEEAFIIYRYGASDAKLEVVDIPKTVKTIGTNAFAGNRGLRAVNIPSDSQLTTIGTGAFLCCSYLVDITLPNSLTSLGDKTFGQCESLVKINIPANTTFNNNSSDTSGNRTFSGCYKLYEVCLENTNYSTVYVGNVDSVRYNRTVPHICRTNANSYVTCENNVYYYHDPSTSEYIALGLRDRNAVEVTLKAETTKIYRYAFMYGAFERITIPASVNELGFNALARCENMNYLKFDNTQGWRCRYETNSSYTYFTSEEIADTSAICTYFEYSHNPQYMYYVWTRV